MKKILFISLVLFFSVILNTKVSAKIIEKNYDRVYEVKDDHIEITEVKAISVTENNFFIQSGAEESFTIFNPVQDDPKAQEKAEQTLSSISLTDNLGNKLNFTSDTTATGNLIIKTKINTGIYSGQTYTITLKYSSYGLIIKSGAVRDVYVPAFSKNYVFEDEQSIERVSTKVVIPKSLGEINILRPVANVSPDALNNVINFSQDDLTGATAWIQIGTTQYYTFNIEQPYTATSNIPIVYNEYKIILPRDISSGPITQKVYFTNISPEPFSTEVDSEGNLTATFRLPVNENGMIKVDGFAVINQNNDVNFVSSGSIEDLSSEFIKKYTASAKYWESDSSEIQELANSLKGDEKDIYKLVEKAYQYVVGKIDYSEVKKFGLNQRQGALATLRGGAAVCMEYSDLFIAILRSMGVPARAAFGSGYSALDGLTSGTNTVNHQWAEVYIPNIDSWVGVDTTWGENGDTLIGGDLNHFYTHVASIDPETPSTTQAILYGRGGDFKDRTIQVSAAEGMPLDEHITQEQLIARYPTKEGSDNLIENILTGVSLLFYNINNSINSILSSIGLPSSLYLFVKIFVIVLLLVIVIFIRFALKKRKNSGNETIYRN